MLEKATPAPAALQLKPAVCACAQVAAAEMARFLADKRTFEALHRQYSQLHYAAQQAGAPPSPQSRSALPNF